MNKLTEVLRRVVRVLSESFSAAFGPQNDIFTAYIRLIEHALNIFIRERARSQVSQTAIGETIVKVELAQQQLSEAALAIDAVKNQIQSERVKLDSLLSEVEAKRSEYQKATTELCTTQELLEKDKIALRAALGINERRTQIIGFISGVIASICAAALWKIATWGLEQFDL
ncbi:MAG: hypothetical protein IT366_24010 [Candidatus Hydrogenedentes bacterium]|nr:hypothetical protein [Candidatus Hydrogenedentota bacterium]